jgi:glycosyltransferase involved in cell wall biosynthesis
MRIALLSDTFPPDQGGLAVSAERLALGLAGAGHSVEVFAPAAEPARPRTGPGLEVRRVAQRRRPEDTLSGWFDELAARHRAAPFDLLHAYFAVQAGFVAVYAGRYLGLPSVVSARGNDLDRAVFDPGRASHILFALQHAGALTTNARELARKAQALAPGRTVAVIPNGVDAARFAPDACAEQREVARAQVREALRGLPGVGGADAETLPLIGFVGEARAKKGLGVLLLALRSLARERPAALLLVGGVRPGADEETLAVFRRRHPELPVLVIPPVARAELPAYYGLLDLLALPSLHDGLPNALLEGMACGCAVVGARAGGLPDALRDGESGLLVPPGDPEALAQAMGALLGQPDRRCLFGQAARAAVLREFTVERELSANLALYRELLGPF